ncbi:MAG TPA: hypothetical protein VF020_20450 [Chthoniobacterales bacterium]
MEALTTIPRELLLFVTVALLLSLVGCANHAPRSVQGKPVSGHIRLVQKQVGYMGSGKLQGEDEVGFHRPEYLEGGKLNVGTGVLDYRGRRYGFGVRGLGAEGIEVSKIRANGEIYGLERLQDFSGTYVRAAQNTVGGLWLENEKGIILRLEASEAVPLFPAGDAVTFKLNQEPLLAGGDQIQDLATAKCKKTTCRERGRRRVRARLWACAP